MDRKEAVKRYFAITLGRNLGRMADFALLDTAAQDALLTPWLADQKTELQANRDKMAAELQKMDDLIAAADGGIG
jgi:hypothetical protein